MAIVYKDIEAYTPKATLSGTEKIPVSDTEYITPAQIVEGVKKDIFSEGQNYTPSCTINSSGGIDGNAPWFIMNDYIPVNNGDVIVWNPGTNNWGGYLCLYNSSKTFLDNYAANAAERTITLNNANVAYIRAPFFAENFSNAKIVVNGVTVWKPSTESEGVSTSLQKLAEDISSLTGENNIRFVIQNGTTGNYLDANRITIRGDKTTVIPVTPGHKYQIVSTKAPASGYTFYFRPTTYSTVSPSTFTSDRVRAWADNWNNYMVSGDVFEINSGEAGMSVTVDQRTAPSDSATVSALRESDFTQGDIVIIDVTNSRLADKAYVDDAIDDALGDIETLLAAL